VARIRSWEARISGLLVAALMTDGNTGIAAEHSELPVSLDHLPYFVKRFLFSDDHSVLHSFMRISGCGHRFRSGGMALQNLLATLQA
jgi:hypothetical protein